MKNVVSFTLTTLLLFVSQLCLGSNIEICSDEGVSHTIHINDQAETALTCITSPVIICPSNYFGCPGESTDPSNTGFATATPGDANCEDPVVTYQDIEMTTGPCTGQIFFKRIWTANYPNNSVPWLYADCTQVVILEDNNDPTITNCPSDITVTTDANCTAVVTWNEPSASDDCQVISFVSNYASGDVFPAGNTTVTYTATDNCGNTSTCSFIVTVIENCCTAPPTITCPADYVGCPNAGMVCGECLIDNIGSGILGIAEGQNSVFKYNPATGGFASIVLPGNPGGTYSVAVDPFNHNVFYFVGNNTLYVGDFAANTYTSLANLSGVTGVNGIDFTVNGDLFAVDDNDAYQINLSTGAATFLFNTGVNPARDIVQISDGTFWVGGSNNIFQYDSSGNLINTYPISNGPAKGITVDDCGIIYYASGTGIYSLDVNNGASSSVYQIMSLQGISPNDLDSYFLDNPVTNEYVIVTDCNNGDHLGTYDLNGNPYTPVGCSSPNPDGCSLENIPGSTGPSPALTGTATGQGGPNCPEPTISYNDVVVSTGPCQFQIEIERTWTATDPNTGLSSSCVQEISLEDNTPPTISNCPANISINSNANCEGIANWNEPNGHDNCGTVTLTSSHASGDVFPAGNTTVTYTATDNCGNTSTCSFIVTVIENCCTAPPTITCPADYVGCPNAGMVCGECLIDNIGSGILGIAEGQNSVFKYNPATGGFASIVLPGNPGGTYSVAVDPFNHNVFYFVGNNTLYVGDFAANTYTSLANLSGVTGVNGIDFTVNGDLFAVDDNDAYQINLSTGAATFLFNTGVNPARDIVQISDGTFWVGGSNNIFQYDSSGNLINTYPISNGPAKGITVDDCGIIYYASGTGIYSLDVNNGASSSVYQIMSLQGISPNDLDSYFLDNPVTNEYVIVTDCNNGDHLGTYDLNGNPYTPVGCSSPNPDGCSLENIPGSTGPSPALTGTATGQGGPNCPEPTISYNDVVVSTGPCQFQIEIERTWTATDPNTGLSSSCVQEISLEDNTPPTFNNCPSDITVDGGGNCQKTVTWTAPVASDNCGVDNVTSNYSSGQTFQLGATTVTYTATDNCGNTTVCSFVVTVVNTVIPSIICPSNFNGCAGTNTDPSVTGTATASTNSNCPGTEVTYTDNVISSNSCGETIIERTWIATVIGYPNLTNTCIQTIDLSDDYAPSIMNCPANIVTSGNGAIVSWVPPTATDNCGTVTLTSNHNPGDFFPIGVTTVIYTATDNCGNTANCEFTITINNPLVVNCPDDIYTQCTTNGGAIVHWNEPTSNTTCGMSCSGNPFIPGYLYMGIYNGHRYYCSNGTATWDAAQAAANSLGGYLAVINTAAENSFLANQLINQTAWIGLTDTNSEGNFEWVNGDPLTYTNWYVGQPNNYNNAQDHVEMLSSGQWNDQYQTSSLEFIIEIPCLSVVQTAGPSNGTLFPIGTTSVEYLVTDACGNSAVCKFDVHVESDISIQCPNDVTLSCPGSGFIVNWDTPKAFTCCEEDCSTGGHINGFVYMGEFNGSQYYCSVGQDLWTNAQAVCVNNGGHLAVINTPEENQFLANILTNQSAFIGLSDAQNEGNFQWVNGDPLNYTNWYTGQPNNFNGNQDYVELMPDGQWNDQYNDMMLEYIMEVPSCTTVTQIAGPPSGSFFPNGTETTITYAAEDNCGNVDTCSFDITIIPSGCNSGGQVSTYNYINHFGFHTINNTSGDNGGYEDFTNLCTTISPGNSYQITLNPGFGGNPAQTMYWKVWTDWNMDGDFNDQDEYTAYGAGPGTLTGLINMPTVLWNGTVTMRVVMKAGSYPDSPCESFAYGETEDYCINVVGAGDFQGQDDTQRTIHSRSEPSSKAVHLFGNVDKESVKQLEFKVFPNPAVERFSISSDNDLDGASLSIQDSQGRLIKSLKNENLNQREIDIEDLKSGIYLIMIQDRNGSRSSKKLIVR